MIIYNNNIISNGIRHEDGNPIRWLSPQVGRYKRVYEPGNVVIDDMWAGGTVVTVTNTSSTITGILGFTGPVEADSSVSWLTPSFLYRPPGQAYGVALSALTSQNLLNYKEIERKEIIDGRYTDDTPYIPVTLNIRVDANSGSTSRTGSIRFRKRGTTSMLFPYKSSGIILTPYTIRITQRGAGTVSTYGTLIISNIQMTPTSLPEFTHAIYTINVGGIKTLTLDTRSTSIPWSFGNIQSGSYNITITGFGYTGTGQRYKLSCTSSPSTVTIPANGSDSIVIRVTSASLLQE